MPLYDYRCKQHGTWEMLAKFDDAALPCPSCGHPGVRQVSMPAKMTTLWNAGWNSGLGGNGFFSYSAGQRVSNKREEERIMNARGKINIKDLGGDAFEDSFIAGKQRERDDHEKLVTTYQNNLKAAGGDKLRAVTETFPAGAMLEQAYAHDAKAGT